MRSTQQSVARAGRVRTVLVALVGCASALLALRSARCAVTALQLRGTAGGIPVRRVRVGREVRYDPHGTVWTYELPGATPTEAPYAIEFRNSLELRSAGDPIEVRCLHHARRCVLSDGPHISAADIGVDIALLAVSSWVCLGAVVYVSRRRTYG